MSNSSTPMTIVIFGASGDLCKRKLIPALFNLYRKERMPDDFRIVGYSRRPWNHGEFRAIMKGGIDAYAGYRYAENEWLQFEKNIHHIQGTFENKDDFSLLAKGLTEIEDSSSNRLYYLASPPQFFIDIIANLASVNLTAENKGWRRVVVEKPFGNDLASARKLNDAIHLALKEHQIYRIDHYLGKETVQNVLVFRFANTIFEPVWNRNYIDHVQITVAEDVGVEHRAGYYDDVGVIRDMFQNHLLQLLTLVAMEPPATFKADPLRNEKVKVLSGIQPLDPNQMKKNMVRGQYIGYTDEDGVSAESETETFAAIRLYINNWRWQGVPFYLRSGKRLARKTSAVIIYFKCPPHMMFPLPPEYQISPNVLALCIQPDEGIHLRFDAKVPDTAAEMRPVDMEFHYADSFGGTAIPDAYERLLIDAMHGDASLFTRSDEIELAWSLIDPLVQGARGPKAPPLSTYPPGSWGPSEADEFIAKDGRRWVQGCDRHHQ